MIIINSVYSTRGQKSIPPEASIQQVNARYVLRVRVCASFTSWGLLTFSTTQQVTFYEPGIMSRSVCNVPGLPELYIIRLYSTLTQPHARRSLVACCWINTSCFHDTDL